MRLVSGEWDRKQLTEMTPTANQFWAAALARLNEAERDLGSLSPAEGAVAACLLERVEATRPLSRFVPATTPNCRPVIRPNWDYFDRSLPRTAIQLITIGLRGCTDNAKVASRPNPAGCTANLALLRSLDWEQVKALMDR